MSVIESFEAFVDRIPGLAAMSRQEQARYFLYFLTSGEAQSAASPSAVASCFRDAALSPYDDVRFYLRRAAQRPAKGKALLVHGPTGYRLERDERERIRQSLCNEPHRAVVESSLRSLSGKMSVSSERAFFDEAVKCFEVGAHRAAVLLTWLLAIDHLFEFIIAHHLVSFNAELAKVTDKRVKVAVIRDKDDFGDIPEGRFIEIARAAGVLSNDTRKILDQKLGIRNTYAHPSGVGLTPIKAADFLSDLVENVILKYPL